jgi:hypothetical protein
MLKAVIAGVLIASAAYADKVLAESLPDLDTQSYCNRIGGSDAKRVKICIANESSARIWLESQRLNPAILYQCTTTLTADTSYVRLRACIISRRSQGQ